MLCFELFHIQIHHIIFLLIWQIQENEYIKIENDENSSKLTISSTKQEHCGCYTLVVENKLGSRQAQVNLTVVGKSKLIFYLYTYSSDISLHLHFI